MATQIKVNSATGNVTIQLSRTVIGTVVTANTANYANFAGTANVANNLSAATTANVVIGGGVDGYVLQTNGAGVTSWVAQTGGGGTPGGANTQVQYNDEGSFGGNAQFTYDDTTDTLNVGTITATNIGNITPTNLDGNVANVLRGDGTFAADGVGSYGDSNVVTLLNAFGSNTITTTGLITGDGGGLSNIVGANVSGAVANATHATVADSANAVTGANVSGAVPLADLATFATTANLVAVANVSGIGNIATTNYNGVATDVLHGDGTWSADLTNYSNSNVVSLMNAFGSNTINTTGNVSVGNLEVVGVNGNITLTPDTEVINSKRYATVNRATESVTLTAGSFLVGEFYTIVTTGTTDFTLIGAGTSYTAGSFNIGETLTILTTGTTDFTLIGAADSNPGTTFTATGIGSGTGTAGSFEVGTQFNATGVGSGTGTAKYQNDSNQAFVTDNYDQAGSTSFDTYANTSSGHLAKGGSIQLNSYGGIGNAGTDPIVPSILFLSAYPQNANLANPTTTTGTSMQITGGGADGFLTLVGSGAGDAYGSEAWKQFQYRPKAMGFIRRNGDADNRLSSAANDETSLNFYNTQNRTGRTDGQLWNYPAKMGAKVDPTWVDPGGSFPGTGVPQGFFFNVVTENFANLEHRMYANGDTIFNTSGGGTPITLGYNGVITGDGGGLSNIAGSTGTQIVNGTSNVSVALNSNVTVGVNSFTNVLDIGQTVTTAPAFTATTGVFTGDGGGLSNVSATATPGGFFDTIQFNDGGTLAGNSSFQFIPGSLPEVQLNGSAGSSPARLLLQDAILTVYTQDLSGGYAPFSFDTHNNVGGFMEPINYRRTRGTRGAQTAVQAGDMVKNERMQGYSSASNQNAYAGGQISTIQANDGLGNLAVTTTISTANPASGSTSLDKILLDTEFVQVAGNLQMNNTDARFTAGRIAQVVHTFATLPASPVQGERAMIQDGPAYNTFGTVVSAGGGSNYMPLFWNGSDWRMG